MRVCLALIWMLVLSASLGAAEIPGSTFRSGVWDGGAYSFDETGQFSHCGISTPYKSRDSLFFFANYDGTYNLGISKPDPVFKQGEVFPVTFIIDRRAPLYGEGVAHSEKFAILRIYDSARGLDALKRGSVLRILSQNQRSGYNLGGTFKAFETARQCAAHYRGYVGKPTARAAASPPARPQIDQTLLYQIATNMIAGYGILDSRYLSDEEVKSFTDYTGVFWTSQSTGLIGGVFYGLSRGIQHLHESDTRDMDEIAGTCTGDLATAARDLEPENGYPARVLQAVCGLETEIQRATIRKYLMDDLVLYVMVMHVDPVGSTVPEQQEIEREQLGQAVAAQAVSLVLESR